MRTKNVQIHAALESVYGTAITLTSAHAIVCTGLKLMPFKGSTVSRDLDRGAFGNSPSAHVGVHQGVTFKTELVASGVLGTAPKWGILAMASGFNEVTVAVTSVRYVLTSSPDGSLTMGFNIDGQLHLLTGARGTVKLQFDSQGYPYLEWEFTGLWNDPATQAALARVTTGWIKPRPVTFEDTPTVEFYGITSGWVLKSLKVDVGNKIEYFNNPGEEQVDQLDREVKGDIELLAPILSTFNVFTTCKADTESALKVIHGTVAVNRVIIEGKTQLLSPDYGDDKGRVTIKAGLSFNPTDANDDEFEIRCAAA